jgi:hypothetical protein
MYFCRPDIGPTGRVDQRYSLAKMRVFPHLRKTECLRGPIPMAWHSGRWFDSQRVANAIFNVEMGNEKKMLKIAVDPDELLKTNDRRMSDFANADELQKINELWHNWGSMPISYGKQMTYGFKKAEKWGCRRGIARKGHFWKNLWRADKSQKANDMARARTAQTGAARSRGVGRDQINPFILCKLLPDSSRFQQRFNLPHGLEPAKARGLGRQAAAISALFDETQSELPASVFDSGPPLCEDSAGEIPWPIIVVFESLSR